MRRETMQRTSTPTAVLVGLAEPLLTTCIEVLTDEGLKVLRAAHVAAAGERIPIVMPQLVIVASTLRPEELDQLQDRCLAVGAAVLALQPKPTEDLADRLRDAARVALKRALGSR
jgi:hypothetical protein